MKKFRLWLFGFDAVSLFDRAATLEVAHHKLLTQHREMIGQIQPLRDAISTLEGAGVRRTFGGAIDVDYDRLLNALGKDGEAELARTIALRETEGAGSPSAKAKAPTRARRAPAK